MIEKTIDTTASKVNDINKNNINESPASASDEDVKEFELELDKVNGDKISKKDSESNDKSGDNSEEDSDNKDEVQLILSLNKSINDEKVKHNKEIALADDKDNLNTEKDSKKKVDKESLHALKFKEASKDSHKDIHKDSHKDIHKDKQNQENGKKIVSDKFALDNENTSSYNIKNNDPTPGGAILSNVNKPSASASEKMALISTIIDKINSGEGIGKNNAISISIDKGHFMGLEIEIKVDKGNLSISFNHNASQLDSLQQLMPDLSERLNKLNQDQDVKLVLNDISDDQSDNYAKGDSEDSESKQQDDIIEEWLEEQRGD